MSARRAVLCVAAVLLGGPLSSAAQDHVDPPGGGGGCTTGDQGSYLELHGEWTSPSFGGSTHIDLDPFIDTVKEIATDFWGWLTGKGGGGGGGTDGGGTEGGGNDGGGQGGDGGGQGGGDGGAQGGGNGGGGAQGGDGGASGGGTAGGGASGGGSGSGASGGAQQRRCDAAMTAVRHMAVERYGLKGSQLVVVFAKANQVHLKTIEIKRPIPLSPAALRELKLKGRWHVQPGVYRGEGRRFALALSQAR
jgi:hypothetical protein